MAEAKVTITGTAPNQVLNFEVPEGPPGPQGIPGVIKTDSGYLRGDNGKTYQIVSGCIRNTGSGFAILDDAGHNPTGLSGVVTQDATGITVNFNFTAKEVGSVVVTPDETFAKAGYTVGASVGLTSMRVEVGQPGGIADYISYVGSAWTSLHGIITVTSFNTSTGSLVLGHQNVNTSIMVGHATSRSLTTRATVDGVGATTTNLMLVNNSGVTSKAVSTDHRIWVSRIGTRNVNPTELTAANSNFWIYGMFEV